MDAEGWYRDPWDRHEERWWSAGRATALVRDGDVEGHDPPPAETWDGELEALTPPETDDGATDLLRADEPPGPLKGADEEFNAFAEGGPPG